MQNNKPILGYWQNIYSRDIYDEYNTPIIIGKEFKYYSQATLNFVNCKYEDN